MKLNAGDTIRIKTIHPQGFYPDTYDTHGFIYIVLDDNCNKNGKRDIRSILTGKILSITEDRYEISKVYNFDLPEELFTL